MTRIKLLVISVVGFMVAATSAHGVINIQNLGASARSAALGNSFVAVADNADAVFANPAGLGQLSKRQLSYTNVSLLYGGIDGDNLGQHVVSYAQQLGSKLGLGLGYERIGSDLMSENGAFLALSLQASQSFQLGVTAKYLFWSVGDIPPDNGVADPLSNQSAGNIGLDVGVLWKTPVEGAQLGVLLKNVNQPNVAKDTSLGDGLPMDLHLGLAYQLGGGSMVSVQWVARDLSGDEVDNRVVVGGETRLVEGLMLRAGGSKLFETDASGELNAGLGYVWNKLLFDYSYNIPLDLRETNGAHRFSLGYEF